MAVKWNDAMNAKDLPEFVDIFVNNRMSSEKVREYVDIVWAATVIGGTTPKYFKKYGTTKPADTPALEANRNTRILGG
eukprot:9856417-Ditylum_brightwellii.AAC.1